MSRRILGAAAATLILGVSAVAIAQSGGDVRSTDRKTEKALDHQKLTPIRPIRRVGPEDWPMGDPSARADNTNKPRETTGQTAQDSKTEQKQDQAKQQPPEPPKQDQAKQEPKQPQPNQQPSNQNTAQQQQPTPTNQQTQQTQQPQNNQQSQQTNNQPQQNQQRSDQGQQRRKQDDFASVRLGTDPQGKVAINDAQERQIFSALRRQRVRPADVSVTIGVAAPANVRLGAVSADIVAVLPQFRGYSFFATRDELVIVEPADKKVVALVPLNGSQIASRPERERSPERSTDRTRRSADRTSERSDSVSRSASASSSRRESKRETTGAGAPSEDEILNAPLTGSGRATRIEPDDDGTVVIERRHHRPRIFGVFRF